MVSRCQRQKNNEIWLRLIIPILLLLLPSKCSAAAARFSVTGPVVTLTLKDEHPSTYTNGHSHNPLHHEERSGNKKWIDFGSLRPNVLWSIASSNPPLPHWLPSLQSCRLAVGYRHDEVTNRPAFVEGDVRFTNELLGDIQIQPTYEWKPRKGSVVLQATKGASYLVARLTHKGRQALEFLRASYLVNLPFAAVGAVRVTSSFDFVTSSPFLSIEGVTGSGRTKAVLNLQYQEPTLTVVHALDERNTIAPEISLHTAKILYQWTMAMDSGSLRTKVDPTSAIHVTWTDRAMNGKWVTEFSLPLKGTTVSALAANVRVRRQFTF